MLNLYHIEILLANGSILKGVIEAENKENILDRISSAARPDQFYFKFNNGLVRISDISAIQLTEEINNKLSLALLDQGLMLEEVL